MQKGKEVCLLVGYSTVLQLAIKHVDVNSLNFKKCIDIIFIECLAANLFIVEILAYARRYNKNSQDMGWKIKHKMFFCSPFVIKRNLLVKTWNLSETRQVLVEKKNGDKSEWNLLLRNP